MQNHLFLFLMAMFLFLVATNETTAQQPCPCQNQNDTATSVLDGQWRGHWLSGTTGHRGRLNGSFVQLDSQHVRADFRGTFAKVIPFRYRPVLDIVYSEPNLMIVQGSKKLPLVGTFHYQATISGNYFDGTYQSRRDQGVWRMSK